MARNTTKDITATRKNFADVCEKISCSFITVKDAITLAGSKIPYWEFRKLARESEDFRKMYFNAKEDQTHIGDDIMTDMINESIAGHRDAKDAAHICNMAKWKMEKLNPRYFGDKQAMVLEELMVKVAALADKEMNGDNR